MMNKINQSTANKGVVWHFNPPLATHFDGVRWISLHQPGRHDVSGTISVVR